MSSVIESQKNALESLRIESEHNRQRVIADNQAASDRITKGFEEEKASMKNNLEGLKDHFNEEIRIMQDLLSQETTKKGPSGGRDQDDKRARRETNRRKICCREIETGGRK